MSQSRLCCLVFLAFVLAASPTTQGAEPASPRPNILFAISDDQSYPHCSAYGSKFVQTPGFDRVAREGVLFANAFCASPGCSPSRAAILTGRPTWQLEHAGTHASSFPRHLKVFPDLLAKAGYHIGTTGKTWGPGNYRVSGWERNPAGPSTTVKKNKPPFKGINSNDYAGNFGVFLEHRPRDKPFFFWYGASEPHRVYQQGSGKSVGKKLSDAEVPTFLPDHPVIRGDLLDYAVEVEWFDKHLQRMLAQLDKLGELENTLVVVCSDNGMPFPRAKANLYEFGFHMPLAIRWPAKVKGGRTIDDFVNHIDLAPTFLDVAGAKRPKEMVGESLVPLLLSGKSGRVEKHRDRTFAARERHSSSRVNNLGYPCRAMRTDKYLYIRNFAPDLWPAGDPRGVGKDKFGFYDIDACPSKTFLIENKDSEKWGKYFELSVAKRPAEELFDITEDPGCLHNLADDPKVSEVKKKLVEDFETHLRNTGDPRILGKGDIFETYKRYSRIRKFE